VCGSVALIFNLARSYRKKKDGEEYAPTYKKMSKPGAIFEGASDILDESESTKTEENEENKEEAGDLLDKYMNEEANSFEEGKNNGEDN
jgi:hypothetical protein